MRSVFVLVYDKEYYPIELIGVFDEKAQAQAKLEELNWGNLYIEEVPRYMADEFL